MNYKEMERVIENYEGRDDTVVELDREIGNNKM